MILALRTDSDMAEIVLTAGDGSQVRDRWEAGRRLSGELLDHIKKLLDQRQITWKDLTGVVAFRGPGSFTGLRIGITVANTIAYAQAIPIVGTLGDNWLEEAVLLIGRGENQRQVVPHYGAEPNITKPKGAA